MPIDKKLYQSVVPLKGDATRTYSRERIKPLMKSVPMLDPILNQIYTEYPGMKNVETPVLKADTTFTRDKTGQGDIETFVPGTPYDNNSIHYQNGYILPNPNTKGGAGIVYNPKTNDQTSIKLDMLHLMHGDKKYQSYWNEFRDEYNKSNLGDNPRVLYDKMNPNERKSIDEGDGYNSFESNMIDGNLRTLMLGTNKEDIRKRRYYDGLYDEVNSSPTLKAKWEQIHNYLKTGK